MSLLRVAHLTVILGTIQGVEGSVVVENAVGKLQCESRWVCHGTPPGDACAIRHALEIFPSRPISFRTSRHVIAHFVFVFVLRFISRSSCDLFIVEKLAFCVFRNSPPIGKMGLNPLSARPHYATKKSCLKSRVPSVLQRGIGGSEVRKGCAVIFQQSERRGDGSSSDSTFEG